MFTPPRLLLAAAAALLAWGAPAKADGPDWFTRTLSKSSKPIDPEDTNAVGPLKVSKIPEDPEEHPVGAIVCWTWNLTKEPAWRCTAKYGADFRAADNFARYMAAKYGKDGGVVVIPVAKADWDDAATRKKLMAKVASERLPAFMNTLAERAEETSAAKAKKIRAAVDDLEPEWVDARPVLPRGVKPDGAVASTKGYDDAAVLAAKGGKTAPKDDPDADATAGYEGTTWTGTYRYADSNTDSSVKITFRGGGKLEVLYLGDIRRDATWKENKDGSVTVEGMGTKLRLTRKGDALTGTNEGQGQDGASLGEVAWSFKKQGGGGGGKAAADGYAGTTWSGTYQYDDSGESDVSITFKEGGKLTVSYGREGTWKENADGSLTVEGLGTTLKLKRSGDALTGTNNGTNDDGTTVLGKVTWKLKKK